MKKTMIATTIAALLAGGTVFTGGADASKATYMTAAEAKEIALDTVAGKVMEIDFEREGRYVYYEIEVKNEKEKVELEVNATTGKVKITDREAVKPVKEKPAKKPQVTKYITKAKVIDIAKSKTHRNAIVTDVELDDGRYEIELKRGKIQYEVKIHATTGKVLKVEVDRD